MTVLVYIFLNFVCDLVFEIYVESCLTIRQQGDVTDFHFHVSLLLCKYNTDTEHERCTESDNTTLAQQIGLEIYVQCDIMFFSGCSSYEFMFFKKRLYINSEIKSDCSAPILDNYIIELSDKHYHCGTQDNKKYIDIYSKGKTNENHPYNKPILDINNYNLNDDPSFIDLTVDHPELEHIESTVSETQKKKEIITHVINKINKSYSPDSLSQLQKMTKYLYSYFTDSDIIKIEIINNLCHLIVFKDTISGVLINQLSFIDLGNINIKHIKWNILKMERRLPAPYNIEKKTEPHNIHYINVLFIQKSKSSQITREIKTFKFRLNKTPKIRRLLLYHS